MVQKVSQFFVIIASNIGWFWNSVTDTQYVRISIYFGYNISKHSAIKGVYNFQRDIIFTHFIVYLGCLGYNRVRKLIIIASLRSLRGVVRRYDAIQSKKIPRLLTGYNPSTKSIHEWQGFQQIRDFSLNGIVSTTSCMCVYNTPHWLKQANLGS